MIYFQRQPHVRRSSYFTSLLYGCIYVTHIGDVFYLSPLYYSAADLVMRFASCYVCHWFGCLRCLNLQSKLAETFVKFISNLSSSWWWSRRIDTIRDRNVDISLNLIFCIYMNVAIINDICVYCCMFWYRGVVVLSVWLLLVFSCGQIWLLFLYLSLCSCIKISFMSNCLWLFLYVRFPNCLFFSLWFESGLISVGIYFLILSPCNFLFC